MFAVENGDDGIDMGIDDGTDGGTDMGIDDGTDGGIDMGIDDEVVMTLWVHLIRCFESDVVQDVYGVENGDDGIDMGIDDGTDGGIDMGIDDGSGDDFMGSFDPMLKVM